MSEPKAEDWRRHGLQLLDDLDGRPKPAMVPDVTDPAYLASLIERVGLVGKESVEEAVRVERDRCLRLAEIYRGSDALRLAIQEGYQPKERR